MQPNSPSSPEQKQHINLSQYAYDVILNDSLTLMGQKNISGFINVILSNCGESYYEDRELDKKEPYPKNVSLKIRLRDAIYSDYYYPSGRPWIGAKFKTSQGEYIKAILEDYSRRTFYERESIYYKSTIKSINDHINQPDDHKGILPLLMTDGLKYYTKPYRISYDYEASFHYLICLSSPEPSGEYRPTSIRISRIASVKDSVTSYGSGKITQKQKKELELRVKSNGVPYMLGDACEFKIRLTAKGLNMYNSIFHQRPMYDSITKEDDSFLLTFFSTERQIQNYFFPFAKEASILSPETTRQWMINRYRKAWESYES